MKRFAHAPEVNHSTILEILPRLLPPAGTVLEIGSGTGQHAVYFTRELPSIIWFPTDADAANVESINAWRTEAGLPNLKKPRRLDATIEHWEIDPVDAVVAINVVHAAPWPVTVGLIAGAGVNLTPGGRLILYGPFRRSDRKTSASNEEFDARIQREHPGWGLREPSTHSPRSPPRAASTSRRSSSCSSHNLIVSYRKPWQR